MSDGPAKPARQPVPVRGNFRRFEVVPTRWADNDVYGHVNNAVYYLYIDTAVNRHLIEEGGLVVADSPVIGIVVETGCRYHRSFTYPEDVEVGLRVAHLGASSVRYEVGLFTAGEDVARADGHFVHVYVDRQSMRPVALPERMRAALLQLQLSI